MSEVTEAAVDHAISGLEALLVQLAQRPLTHTQRDRLAAVMYGGFRDVTERRRMGFVWELRHEARPATVPPRESRGGRDGAGAAGR